MTEEQQLAELTAKQKRWLKKYCCGWCDHPLDKVGCSAMYERCDECVRVDRRREALEDMSSNIV